MKILVGILSVVFSAFSELKSIWIVAHGLGGHQYITGKKVVRK